MKAMAFVAAAALSLAAHAQEDPEAVYGKFHRALHAGDLAEMNRHGSPGGAAELSKMPPAQQKQMLELMKKMVPEKYSVTGKQPGPDGNSFVIHARATGTNMMTGAQEQQFARISLLKIGGQWKVDKSSWSNKPPQPEMQMRAAPTPAPQKQALKAEPRAAAPRAASAAVPAVAAPVLGRAKEPCVYKPVMTAQDLENCR